MSQFIACYNQDQVTILSLKGGLESRTVLRFNRDEKVFEGIFHCQIASTEPQDDDDNQNFRCQVACLSATSNQIIIFDLTEDIQEK